MTGTFEGVGSLQFTPDNKFAYAYSGTVSFNGDETNIVVIKSESFYLVGKFQLGVNNYDGDDLDVGIKFNDQQILLNRSAVTGTNGLVNGVEWDIVVPPFTEVALTAENKTDTTSYDAYGIFVGKVYGAIEQQNLEAITDNNKWASL